MWVRGLVLVVPVYLLAAVALPFLAAGIRPALPNTLAGATLLVCGLLLVEDGGSRRGVLLVLAGTAWFAVDFAPLFDGMLRSAFDATSLAYVGFLTHAAVTVSDVRLLRPVSRLATGLGYAAALAAPTRLAEAGLIAVSLGLVLVAADTTRQGRRLRRGRPTLPLGSVVPLVLAAGLFVPTVLRMGGSHLAETTLSRLVVLAVVSVGVLSTGDVRSLPGGGAVAGGQDSASVMAKEIGDLLGAGPVGVWFLAPDRDGWIDYAGCRADIDPAALRIVTLTDGQLAGLAITDAIPPLVRDDLRRLLRVAADHADLNLRVRERSALLEASSRRLVESSDDERGHLQAELRDRAGRALDLAVESIPADSGLAELRARARSTRTALSSIARGIDPLGDRVLRECLEDLVSTAAVPVTLSLRQEPSGPAARTVWFVCSEALANVHKHAPGSRVAIALDGDADTIRLTVTDDGPGGADPDGRGLRGLDDRAAALGGRLRVESGSPGTRLELTLPRRMVG